MGKGGRKQKKDTGHAKRRNRDEGFGDESMDDEIDACNLFVIFLFSFFSCFGFCFRYAVRSRSLFFKI